MTHRTNQDYTNHELRIMCEMFEEGESFEAIAKRVGRTKDATYVKLHSMGKRRSHRYTPEQCERILTCRNNVELALEIGTTPEMIITKRYKLKKAMRNAD